MSERIRPHAEHAGGPAAPSDIFADQEGTGQPVTVSSGPYIEDLPVGNSTVGEIRRRFADRFDLDPTAQATLNGVVVDDQTTVRAGQALMFTRPAGEKGRAEGRARYPQRAEEMAQLDGSPRRVEDNPPSLDDLWTSKN